MKPVRNEIWNRVGLDTQAQVENQFEEEIHRLCHRHIKRQIYIQVGDQVWEHVWHQMLGLGRNSDAVNHNSVPNFNVDLARVTNHIWIELPLGRNSE